MKPLRWAIGAIIITFALAPATFAGELCAVPEHAGWTRQTGPQRVDATTGRSQTGIMYLDHEYIDKAKNLIVEYRFEDSGELAIIQWFELVTYTEQGIDTVRRVFAISGGTCTLNYKEKYFMRVNSRK